MNCPLCGYSQMACLCVPSDYVAMDQAMAGVDQDTPIGQGQYDWDTMDGDTGDYEIGYDPYAGGYDSDY